MRGIYDTLRYRLFFKYLQQQLYERTMTVVSVVQPKIIEKKNKIKIEKKSQNRTQQLVKNKKKKNDNIIT